MLKEQFLGRNPSHFHVNPIVKAFIVSEMLIWSAWNFIAPIFALFAATKVPGGNIEIAASSYSAHLIARVFAELFAGRYLAKSSSKIKLVASVIGITIVSLSFTGFAFTTEIYQLYLFYAVSGLGIGIATPAKNSLFSTHLDKNKETTEWGIYDAATFTCTALAATAGGLIAKVYGFQFLFLIATFVSLLGILPYLLYIPSSEKKTNGEATSI